MSVFDWPRSARWTAAVLIALSSLVFPCLVAWLLGLDTSAGFILGMFCGAVGGKLAFSLVS